MKILRKSRISPAGFTLIEVIVSIVLGAISGGSLFSYMGTQLTHSGDPINITRARRGRRDVDGAYRVRFCRGNEHAGHLYGGADYHLRPGLHQRPLQYAASVTLTRTYVTYNGAGDEVTVTGGGTSTNLKVTVQAGGHSLTNILTAERVASGDPITFFLRGDMLKREADLRFIEIVVTLVLVGILSVFAGLFMTTFLNGYFMVKNNSDTAMKAQMALDRISLELQNISPVSSAVVSPVSVLTDNSLITYTNPSGANRTIKFVGSNIYLSTLRQHS